jgi:hypothetical protein
MHPRVPPRSRRRNTTIVTRNDAIVTLHLNDEECRSKQRAPYGELHGEDTPCLHQAAPNAVKRQVGLHELIILPSKLLEDGVQYQVDNSATIDEHPRDWLPVDVTPNVQWLQALASHIGCHILKFSFWNVNHFSHKKLKISKRINLF